MEQDTVKLLRECDAGIKMGIASIDDVLDYVYDQKLKELLSRCKAGHEALKSEIQKQLDLYHDTGKEPNPMAKSMSWVKTNVKLAINESDNTIADLMTDGCNMGVKSLGRYLNQYKAASEQSKELARRLIALEDQLAVELRAYL
jgi:peptide subunit release factor 1 (eRF1)